MSSSAFRNSCKIQTAKCVVVGDENVGKSSLIVTYTTKCFPDTTDVFTVFENTSVHIPFGDSIVNLQIWDAAPQDAFSKLRAVSYSECNVFLLCFSIVSPPTFENVLRKWYPELLQSCPAVPIILVGCKSDLRENEAVVQKLAEHDMKPISTKQANRMAKQLGINYYVECSSYVNPESLNSAFEVACKEIVSDRNLSPKSRRASCSLPSKTTAYGSLKFKNVDLPFDQLMDESLPSTNDFPKRKRSSSAANNANIKLTNSDEQKKKEKKQRRLSMKPTRHSDTSNSSSRRKRDSCIVC